MASGDLIIDQVNNLDIVNNKNNEYKKYCNKMLQILCNLPNPNKLDLKVIANNMSQNICIYKNEMSIYKDWPDRRSTNGLKSLKNSMEKLTTSYSKLKEHEKQMLHWNIMWKGQKEGYDWTPGISLENLDKDFSGWINIINDAISKKYNKRLLKRESFNLILLTIAESYEKITEEEPYIVKEDGAALKNTPYKVYFEEIMRIFKLGYNDSRCCDSIKILKKGL